MLIFFTLGSSQAMKGAWLEDMLSLPTPTAFLTAARVRSRPRRFPFGRHRAVEIGYLTAAALHDTALYADAQTNRADWMTGRRRDRRVVGIGLGVWWLDAAAAIVIGPDIFRDGDKYTSAAMRDLLDGRPRSHDEEAEHPVNAEVCEAVSGAVWSEEAAVRMRDTGHVFNVEELAVPVDEADDPIDRVEELADRIRRIDWKLQDVVVAVVRELEGAPEDVIVRRDSPPRAGSPTDASSIGARALRRRRPVTLCAASPRRDAAARSRADVSDAEPALTPREMVLHGHVVTYRTAGRGPVLLLPHGIANSSQSWERVATRLSERFSLIAPDLLGQGESATPRGDYSLGAHAAGVRDLRTPTVCES